MATLNVTEDPYNAAGDGTTDDRQAIQDAIDDAGDGDTVYLPATTDSYRVTDTSNVNNRDVSFTLTSTHTGKDITIEGDGEETTIKHDATGSDAIFTWPLEQTDGGADFTMTVRNMVMETTEPNDAGLRGLYIHNFSGGDERYSGQSLHFEDLRFDGLRGISMQDGDADNGFSTVTMTRIDVLNCVDNHAYELNANETISDVSGEADISNTFKSLYADNTGGGGFHTLSISGSVVVDGFYLENGNDRNKISNDNIYVVLKNGVFADYDLAESSGSGVWFGPTSTSGLGYTVEWDRVAFRGTVEMGAIRTSADSAGQNLGSGPVEMTGIDSFAVRGRYDAADADNNDFSELRLKNIPSSYYAPLEGEGTADLVEHENVEDDLPGDWTVNTLNETTITQLDLAGPSEVGAFTDTDTADTYSTDFTDTTLDEWTNEFAGAKSDFAIVNSGDSELGGRLLELDATTATRRALSWDVVGEATDAETLVLGRVVSDEDDSFSWTRSYVSGGGSASDERGYFVSHRDDTDGERALTRYEDGNRTLLAQTGTLTVGDFYWHRLQRDGDTIRARWWPIDTDEPTSWDVTHTDANPLVAGWAGVGAFSADRQQWDYVAVGVGGASPAVPSTDDAIAVGDDTASQRDLHERIAAALDPTVDRPRPIVGALALSTDTSDIDLNATDFDGEVARVEPSEPPTITDNTISYTFEFDETQAENETIERLVATEDLDAFAPSATALLDADSFESDASNTITVQMDIDVLDISEGN